LERSIRFVLFLVLGLAALTFGASLFVQRQTRAWFDKDLNLRAQLAVNGARRELVQYWQDDPARLADVLGDMTQDERILGACACSSAGQTLACTPDVPAGIDCARLVERVVREGPNPEWGHWAEAQVLPGGEVHLAAVPLSRIDTDGQREELGYVVIVHDLSFVARREVRTRQFLLGAFGVLAVSASLVTLVASRLSWRRWSADLRRFLRGDRAPAEFSPILSDVRELVDRLLDQEGHAWTPQRLRDTLRHHLRGEKVVVLANREPYVHVKQADGSVTVMHPASGLVTALEPILRACSGTWIAHGSGSGDHETADRNGRLRVPPGEGAYVLRRVWLTREEEKGYYYGFANEGLWPLCHIAHTRPTFRGEDWEQYRAVNAKFVSTVLEEVDSDDPIILVQDYHFALAPALIRRVLPRAKVLMFWHIPWPNAEQFGICPFSDEILEGMLGASILGFHTQFHCNNFLDAVDRSLEARIDRERDAVVHHGHETLVHPYPISVEWPMRQLAGVPDAKTCRAEVLQELGLPSSTLLGVGVDRMDYTKGIQERLLAVERLFERNPEYLGRFTFVQLAAPSRTEIERYRLLNEEVEALAQRIVERFQRPGWRPIVLLRAHHEPPTVFRYLRAGDLCYVSSLDDGMNLVAKEFVAAREDERGVLVLSQFTGAARELTEALIVNPYNLDEGAAALATALEMPADEQQMRLRAMRSYLAEFNVYGWAGRMLIDAARLQRRERLSHSLNGGAAASAVAG